jgi:hypothetical protein
MLDSLAVSDTLAHILTAIIISISGVVVVVLLFLVNWKVIDFLYNKYKDFSVKDLIPDTIRYDLYRGLKNLWVWRRIIFLDRSYDYDYFLKIVEFKLDRMAEDFQDGNCESSPIKAAEMKALSGILFALRSDDKLWRYYKMDNDRVSQVRERVKRIKETNDDGELIKKPDFMDAFYIEEDAIKYEMGYDHEAVRALERGAMKILRNYRSWWD